MIMERTFFEERQRFRQWWIYLVMAGSMAAWVYAFSVSVAAAESEKAAPDIILLFTGVIPLLLIMLFATTGLETRISSDGLHYRFRPFHLREKHIDRKEIISWEVRKYRPIAEYGGWGIRSGGKKYGKAFNVSGNMGLQLYLANGKKLLIGTRMPAEAEKAMKKMMDAKV
jgi:hypothetical protein